MKIGLYGGTFDPVHRGHVQPVVEAKAQLGLDRVIYLPTADPPHKPERSLAPALARYAMVELALLEYPNLVVSPYELTPRRTAYTVDSARHFRSEYPDDELYLLIGGDAFVQLTTWREWRELVSLCRLGVLVRPGWGLERMRAALPADLLELAKSDRVQLVVNQPVEVSSTRLRELVAAGEEIPAGAVAELVVQYIEKYKLYS